MKQKEWLGITEMYDMDKAFTAWSFMYSSAYCLNFYSDGHLQRWKKCSKLQTMLAEKSWMLQRNFVVNEKKSIDLV